MKVGAFSAEEPLRTGQGLALRGATVNIWLVVKSRP